MKTIWKFPIEITDKQAVKMTKYAHILDVQFQGDQLCLWAELETNDEPIFRTMEVYGTGNPIPENEITDFGGRTFRDYIGTAQNKGFVWHVFERVESR